MDDLISRQTVLEMAYDMSEIDGEHFTEPCMVVDVEDIQKLPSVTQKSETVTEFADRCRECGAKYGKLLKQQPCEDAISRQAVIDAIYDMEILKYRIDLENVIKALPSVKPQEKTGHWKMMYEPENMVVCSECGKCAYLYNGRTSTWCPHCGNYKGAKNDT